MRSQVETYSGSRLHELPRRFTWSGRWLEVTRVLRRWREPEHLAFLVRGADGRTYFLKYHLSEATWEAQISGSPQ